MKQLALVTPGLSDYDDRLWEYLSIFKDTNILGYDHAETFPLLLIAGANIRAVDQGQQLVIEVEENKEEQFYNLLERIIENYRVEQMQQSMRY